MITKLEQLIEAVRGRDRKTLVAAYAQDAHTLEAVSSAVDMGIVNAVLVGDRAQIAKVCAAEGFDLAKFTVVDETDDAECVNVAVRMIRDGKADVLMNFI